MITLTFPDQSTRLFAPGITGHEVATSISPSLAKKALAVRYNDREMDLTEPLTEDGTLIIITADSPEGLEIIRHDTAHILAHALKELYPHCQITIGPVIENGFYYDIACDPPLSDSDFAAIEARMAQIMARKLPVTRELWNRDAAVAHFLEIGEAYKAEIIRDIPASEAISLYRQGDFLDLCRGPHAPSTGFPKAFKLQKLAGAYWRGDSRNPMLQRIYGTAWATKEQLDAYLTMLEEAEKRDHRKLGRQLDLFHLQEEAPGMVFWHEKGWTVFRMLEEFIRRKISIHDYREIKTPILLDRSLWEKSGHWEKFRENMFVSEVDEKWMAMKPMSCPCHVQVFNQTLRSYRDLPLRLSEFGTCHRYEASGALHGLLRVRGMTQDDGHIFCTEDQIGAETEQFCALLKDVYQHFGFDHIRIKLSTRPEVRAGSDDVWDRAESALEKAIAAAGMPYSVNPGEGAFYGPKLEFVLRDAIGRDWQCGTWQLDFILPERLGATYIGPDGQKHVPVMLHRAVLGTIERFMGILLEQYSGRLPVWLSPVQISLLPITDEVAPYAASVAKALKKAGIRVVLDTSNEKISYKIRQHSLQKVPYLAIIGKNEVEASTVTLRTGGAEDQETYTLPALIAMLLPQTTIPE